jgi:apyrase
MRFRVVVLLLAFAGHASASEYRVMIDAGSSGSRVHIYEFHSKAGSVLPEIKLLAKHKITPGVSSLIDRLDGVPAYVDQLARFAKETLHHDAVQIAKTQIVLQATGGVRALTLEQRAELMRALESALASSGFAKPRVEVVTGTLEGVYQWLTVNYLKGNLGNPKHETTGIVEMGGASLQIAFVPRRPSKQHRIELRVGDRVYDLYAYSYDGFGEASALAKWGHASCVPAGFKKKKHKGNYATCKKSIAAFIDKPCVSKGECGLDGIHQPKAHGEFVAIDNFQHMAELFSIDEMSSQTADALGQKTCPLSWEKLVRQYPNASQKVLSIACFDLAYMSLILAGPGAGTKAKIPHQIADTPISWTLGALLHEILSPPLAGQGV